MGDSMSTIINATTTNGVVIQPDNSGSLVLQTNSGTTALTIDTSQRAAFVAGTAALPAITTTGDTNTGMFFPAADTIAFAEGGTEAMRITSGGYFKASNNGDYSPEGATSTVHQFCQSNNSVALSVVCTNTSQSGDTLRLEGSRNTTNNSWYFVGCFNRTANAFKLQIADSGNVTNTNGSYGTISDIKNKENIVDATPKLDKVNQLKVRNFNFKGDDLKQIGFVAQEFEQVFPSMVEEHLDKDAEGNDLGTTTKSIKTSVLVPILVKAIQEQQTIINDLKARVETLEAK